MKHRPWAARVGRKEAVRSWLPGLAPLAMPPVLLMGSSWAEPASCETQAYKLETEIFTLLNKQSIWILVYLFGCFLVWLQCFLLSKAWAMPASLLWCMSPSFLLFSFFPSLFLPVFLFRQCAIASKLLLTVLRLSHFDTPHITQINCKSWILTLSLPLIPEGLMYFSNVREGSFVAASYPEFPGPAGSGLQSPNTPGRDNMDHRSRTGPPQPLERGFFFILCHTGLSISCSTELVHFKQLIYFLKESALFVVVIMWILVEVLCQCSSMLLQLIISEHLEALVFIYHCFYITLYVIHGFCQVFKI